MFSCHLRLDLLRGFYQYAYLSKLFLATYPFHLNLLDFDHIKGTVQIMKLLVVNGKLRRMFGPKRDENGEWRRLHNEEIVPFT